MKQNNQGKIILALSVPLVILLTIASCTGIFSVNFYARETFNWQIQSIGQDMIDLFVIVPVLIVTSIFAYKKNNVATLLWAGTILYLLYTFIIFCFDVHFNRLFIVYCFILGISFYSLAWFIYSQVKNSLIVRVEKNGITRFTVIYFLILPLIFYFLWLSEIVPALISDTVPKNLKEIGLFTNPVQVIDLSVFLPGIFITGFLVLKRKPLGFLFIFIMLTFFILMDITIAWLSFIMNQKGLASDLSVTIIMAVLALASSVLLALNIKNIKIK